MADDAAKVGQVPVPLGGTQPLSGTVESGVTDQEIVNTLSGYFNEASEARRSGPNPRDEKWSQNLDLYWNRYDFSAKARWQARETMPEVPMFVDRFAAALKEALVSTPNGFYTVNDPADKEGDLAQAVKRMTDVWLSTTGRNQVGQLLGFPAVFEEQVKMGAITAMSSVTTWKNDVENGRVAIETVDPRNVYLDPTYRNLYRIRRTVMDIHELPSLANQRDKRGDAIFKQEQLARLAGSITDDMKRWQEEAGGTAAKTSTPRREVTLDEYVATVLDSQGRMVGERSLYVVANGSFLIRGPEKNPYWHEKDWLTFTPLITAPMSPYGRSYMEDFGSVAKTFTDLTNLILDAVHMSSMKAYAAIPSYLINPEQLRDGISPNKLFLLEEGVDPKQFLQEIELGNLSPDSVRVWESMKSELSNAAGMNEIGLGQFAPKGRTSATEISETQQSSSAIIRSVAQTVETRWLDPTLDLVWKTGMQHVKRDDPMLKAAAGDEMFAALIARRRELVSRPVTFQARGISALIARAQAFKALIGILQVVAQSEPLMAQFMQVADTEKLVKRLFELAGVDLTTLQASERELAMRSVTEPLQQLAGNGASRPPSPNTQAMLRSAAQAGGVAQ